MASRTVTVLTINGRRQNVKVEPNTTILEILEQVCQKHNFNAAEYDLKHHNKVLDLSTMFRFSGLPNNALLEMAEAKKARTEADVVLAVQLEDGTRKDGTYKPSATLLQVLEAVCPDKAQPEANPVFIYMRREVFWDAMASTTLKSLGLMSGRAIVRLLQRKPEELKVQANVSAPLPQKERPEEKDEPFRRKQVVPQVEHRKDEQIEPVAEPTPSEETSSEIVDPQPGPSASGGSREARPLTPEQSEVLPDLQINVLGPREAVLFHLETAERSTLDLPDSFFDVTITDVRKMYADLRSRVRELDEAPLMTSDLRKLEDSKQVLNNMGRYRHTIIRVQFPDRYVLQGIFKLHETVADVMAFVREYLEDQALEFHLFTTPPKQVLPADSTLVEVKCVPQALLHLGCPETSPKTDQFLKPALLGRLSNAAGASAVAMRSRGKPAEPEVPTDRSPSTSTSAMDVEGTSSSSSSDNQRAGSSRMPNTNFRPSSVQQAAAPSEAKLPKWFKPTGK